MSVEAVHLETLMLGDTREVAIFYLMAAEVVAVTASRPQGSGRRNAVVAFTSAI